MLKPLYSPSAELVGWLMPDRFIFDAQMTYVAFLARGHAWSAITAAWLGPVVDQHIYDVEGRPVAWGPERPLRNFGKPLRPMNVVRAITPVRPARPLLPAHPVATPSPVGGWSDLGFRAWLTFSDPVAEVPLQHTLDDDAETTSPSDNIGEVK